MLHISQLTYKTQLKRYSINQSARQDGVLNTSGLRDVHTGFRSGYNSVNLFSEQSGGLCASLYANRAVRHPKARLQGHTVLQSQASHRSNMEDSRRTLQESFPVQAFKQQTVSCWMGITLLHSVTVRQQDHLQLQTYNLLQTCQGMWHYSYRYGTKLYVDTPIYSE